MGTKVNPGKFDCYANALPDEPMFILLARDIQFAPVIHQWANRRLELIACGHYPSSDQELVTEARYCARDGAAWRRDNNGIWRKS